MKVIYMRSLGIIILSTFSLFLSAQNTSPIDLLRSGAKSNHVFVAAHRGDWKYAPENSLEGLHNALFFGADIIETDVRQTADGHFIVMHDATVDRTTNGSGIISQMTLAEIRNLRLKTNWGQSTQCRVPTLEEYLAVARDKAIVYLDKAGIDLPGTEEGSTVKALLEVLRREGALQQAMFVLDWQYEKARRIFGSALDSVIYCPVVEDKIPDLAGYVDKYISQLHPVAFQFRMASLESETYRQLPRVLQAGSRAFVAATWQHHTAGHDDNTSIFKGTDSGWGWLIKEGFSIIETNFPKDLIQYLREEKKH